jgi:hypothetical protein
MVDVWMVGPGWDLKYFLSLDCSHNTQTKFKVEEHFGYSIRFFNLHVGFKTKKAPSWNAYIAHNS